MTRRHAYKGICAVLLMALHVRGLDARDQKAYVGSVPETVEGRTCRLAEYAQYLLDVLACETSPDPVQCEEAAYARYCKRHDACPP